MLNLNKHTTTKPKPEPTLILRTAHERVCISLCKKLSYAAQHRTVPSYPPDNHHSSDDVYWRGRGTEGVFEVMT